MGSMLVCRTRGVTGMVFRCKYIPVGHSSYRHALCECLMLRCSTGEEHCGYPMRRHGAVKWNLRAIGWYIGESSIT